MTNEQLTQKLTSNRNEDNQLFDLDFFRQGTVKIYPKSINRINDNYIFIARNGVDKYLYIISLNGKRSIIDRFKGEILSNTFFEENPLVKRCPLSNPNAAMLRELFDFTRPVLIGLENSIGLGCRLGLANPGHLRAVAGTKMRPILAQQSIRELERTNREPEEVIDAATWAVFQEGYKEGFGADADHLKTTKDIDRMVRAGYTMITFDPSEYVVDEADSLPEGELVTRARSIPWKTLEDTYASFISRYESKTFSMPDDFKIQPDRKEVHRALIKYGAALAHIVELYHYLKNTYPDYIFELEISVDETEAVTSSFEHLFVANELKRLGIKIVSLAPCFVGDFEKGIDYKGDLQVFKEEYIKHLKIAESFGPYKISIHSGSDKFRVYEAVGSFAQGYVHVKTAGTSYLEALRTVAVKEPDLFREILDFSRGLYEDEKRTYHVSAKLENVPSAKKCSDSELIELFEQNDARQVLHVSFGKVLTTQDQQGSYLFRERILNCLRVNEETYYGFLKEHFRRHIKPFV